MSDTLVIKRSCERCPAIDEIQLTVEDIKNGKLPLDKAEGPCRFEVKVGGKAVASYRRLCAACEATVAKMVEDIATKREKKTSIRTKSETA